MCHINIDAKGNIDNQGKLSSDGAISLTSTANINHSKGTIEKINNSKKHYLSPIVTINADGKITVANQAKIYNQTGKMYLTAGDNIEISKDSDVSSIDDLNLNTKKQIKVNDSQLLSFKSTNIHSVADSKFDNASLRNGKNLTIYAGKENSNKANIVVADSQIWTEGDINLQATDNISIHTGSDIENAKNINIQANNYALLAGIKQFNATENVQIQANNSATLWANSPIKIGKQLILQSNNNGVYVVDNDIKANKGISISGYKEANIANSQLNSADGAVFVNSKSADINFTNTRITKRH